MSEFDLDIRNTPQRIRDWLLVRVVAVRRVKPGPLFVRVTAAVAAFVAMLFALPVSELDSRQPGCWWRRSLFGPRSSSACCRGRAGSRWSRSWSSCLGAQLGRARRAGRAGPGGAAGRLALPDARGGALAAVLPYDAVLAAGRHRRWAARTAGVTAVALAFGLGGLALAQGLPATRSSVGPIVGSVIAVGLAGLLAWLLSGAERNGSAPGWCASVRGR